MTARERARQRHAARVAAGQCVVAGCGDPLESDELREGYRTCWRCRAWWAGQYLAQKEQEAA